MPQRPAQERLDAPLPLRVYGLEGQVSDLDESVTAQAVTLAKHEERLAAQDVLLAITGTNQTAMQKSMDAVVSELVKTRWTLIAFALSGIGIAFGIH